MMGWGRGDGVGGFLGEVAGMAALVEGDAGVEGTGVGVKGFHDWEAGGNDAEVDFQPDSYVIRASLGGNSGDGRGRKGKTVTFLRWRCRLHPLGFWGQLAGWRGVWGGDSVHDRSFDLIW